MGMFLDEERKGRFTSSQIYKIMSDKSAFKTACYEKANERLEIDKPEQYVGDAIVHGNENEPIGIMTFELVTGKEVLFTGAESEFIKFYDNAGCTPDGLINDKEGLEIKCPFNPEIFLRQFMLESAEDLKEYSKIYYWQVQSSLLFTARELWNFCSYHPQYYQKYRQIGLLQIEPNKSEHALILEKLEKAELEVTKIINKILNK